MQNKIKNAFFSKYTLIFLCIILFSLGIWFLGPYLVLNNVSPLETIYARFSLIFWLLLLLTFILARWPLSPLFFILTSVMFWYISPIFGTKTKKPFESETLRWISISFLFLAYLIYAGFTLWKALRNDPGLVERLFQKKKEKEVVAYKENAKVQALLNVTLTRLKSISARKYLFKDLFRSKDAYLYKLPWYFVLGKSNSGKTTAIANARLAFSIPEQLASAAKYTSLNTHGEKTKNCNFWLTNEALLIDSSGDYIDKSKEENIDASWFGLLKLLKKTRARNAVNGVIVTISTEDLLHNEAAENLKLAAQIGNRLLQLREEFGIIFPVYVCVTKTDILPGFEEYFRSLTIEARDQVLGFTFSYEKDEKLSFSEQIDQEMERLIRRLEQGIVTRLHEEFYLEHRQELYVFPIELTALFEKLKLVVNAIFSESQLGKVQENDFFRGIYFTSAGQTINKLAAKNATVRHQIDAISSVHNDDSNGYKKVEEKLSSNRSYFLRDMFSKVIFTEAGLVKPNIAWQLRSKLLRVCVCVLILAVFIWLSVGLNGSMNANENYLATTNVKVDALRQQMAKFMADPRLEEIPDILNMSADLPNYQQWNLDDPNWDVRYGLYTAPGIQAASEQTYNSLVDHLLLRYLTKRIEVVMQEAVSTSNTEKAANALNVYLMLHTQDDAHYRAKTIKNWVLQDWSQNDSAAVFGNKVSMVEHLDRLFDGKRIVRSQYLPNDALIKNVRSFLSTQPSTVRLYERAKDVMISEAPEDYTLTKVVGPQAGMVFSRLSGVSIDVGVPGLFTYDGYHNLFDKRLVEFIGEAKKNDDWLMGRVSKDTPLTVNSVKDVISDPLAEEIRKLYLAEYTKNWDAFLSDIGTVTGDNLTFDLTVMRVFAAPDSPLSRLARSVVEETTLSKPLNIGDESVLDTVAKKNNTVSKVNNVVNAVNKYGFSAEEQLEKEMVDNHFADLREMVTGSADVKGDGQTAGIIQPSKMNLNYFSALINEYYTYLAMTETAINTGNIPQNSDISLKMQVEASKMPAPFSRILMTFVDSGVQKINIGQSDILRKHAEVQYADLMSTLTSQVTNICSDAIEGKYPFVKSSYEVSIEDFANIFSSGGVLDTFFTTRLEQSVDTSSRPWKYKTVEQINAQKMVAETSTGSVISNNINTSSISHPTLESELAKLLIKNGPNPEFFAQARDIRETFFQEPGSKKVALNLNYRIIEVDPSITELILNFDGQIQRYIHGPVKATPFKWPGSVGGAEAEITANPQIRRDTSTLRAEGPWALFKLLERGNLIKTASGRRTATEFKIDGRRVLLEFSSQSTGSPFNLGQLRKFSCPRVR